MGIMTRTIPKPALTSIAFFIVLIGCAPQHAKRPICSLPSGKLVDDAFRQAKISLENPACRNQFDAVLNTLLAIAEGDPKKENNEAFSDLLVWAKDQGVISAIQAEDYYNRYFTRIFVSLPDDYKICDHCSKTETIMSDCKEELKLKEQGLTKICKDRPSYEKAAADYKAIESTLKATCTACDELLKRETSGAQGVRNSRLPAAP